MGLLLHSRGAPDGNKMCVSGLNDPRKAEEQSTHLFGDVKNFPACLIMQRTQTEFKAHRCTTYSALLTSAMPRLARVVGEVHRKRPHSPLGLFMKM
jgi:hypothetical protein